MIYTISHPETGDCRDFNSRLKAIEYAKKQNYTPVFIDISSDEDEGIVDHIQINNPGKRVIK